MDEHVLRAVIGMEFESKLVSELPIPVVREPSISLPLPDDDDAHRIMVRTVGATMTAQLAATPGAQGAMLTNLWLEAGIQPAATVNEAPLVVCLGESAP